MPSVHGVHTFPVGRKLNANRRVFGKLHVIQSLSPLSDFIYFSNDSNFTLSPL